MKKNDWVQVKTLDLKELELKKDTTLKEIANLVLDKNMKKLKDLKTISKKKKEIAQILTIMQQKQQLVQLEAKVSESKPKKEEEAKISK